MTPWNFPGSLVVKTSPSNTGSAGSTPRCALWPKIQNKKQKQYCNKFNKNFKNGLHPKIILKKPPNNLTYFNEYVPNTVQIACLNLIKLYIVGNFIAIQKWEDEWFQVG